MQHDERSSIAPAIWGCLTAAMVIFLLGAIYGPPLIEGLRKIYTWVTNVWPWLLVLAFLSAVGGASFKAYARKPQ